MALRKIEFSVGPENRISYAELETLYGIENLQNRRERSLMNHMYGQSKKEINVGKERCDIIDRSNKKVKGEI